MKKRLLPPVFDSALLVSAAQPLRVFVLILAVLLLTMMDSAAQEAPIREGVVYLTGWPTSVYETQGAVYDPDERAAENYYQSDILPFLDSLSLEYRYFIEADQPVMTFTLAWVPGAEGVVDGAVVPADQMPTDIRMTALDVLVDVYVDGERVSDLLVSVDSMDLSPAPYIYPIEAFDLSWETLFADVAADTARQYFEAGFELRNLDIIRIAFASYDSVAVETRDPVTVTPRPRRPGRTTVIDPGPDIWIMIGRDNYRPPPRVNTKPTRPRGDTIGRGREGTVPNTRPRTRGTDRTRNNEEDKAEAAAVDTDKKEASDAGTRTRTGEDDAKPARGIGGLLSGKKEDKKDDDDDDDDQDLLPAAVGAAAAVGLIAFAGGTVGYSGNMSETPIGLMSGFVRPGWGMLLQVSVNEAVLGGGGREQLTAGLLGFWDAFSSPIQPAIGAGVFLKERGDGIDTNPSFSLGAVGTFGPMVLHGGYDLLNGGMQFGLGVNFRYRRR